VIGLNEVVSGGEQEKSGENLRRLYTNQVTGRVPIVLSVLILVYLRTEANSKPLLQSMNRFDSATRMLFDEPSSFF